MRKLAHAAIFGFTLITFGCATNVVPVATGGSRSDATVQLSYEYGLFQQPVVDTEQAQASALQRCRVWGYSGADAFGGQRSTCEEFSNLGCTRTLVTVEYQCTGTGVGQPTPVPAMQVQSAAAASSPNATAPMSSQRPCTQQQETQKKIAIQNGYTMIPNCQ